jgi:hypothetical protein
VQQARFKRLTIGVNIGKETYPHDYT